MYEEKYKKITKKLQKILIALLFSIIMLVGSYFDLGIENELENTIENREVFYDVSDIKEYSGQAYIEINDNNPKFTTEDMNLEEDYYSNIQDGKVRNGNYKNLLGKST